MENIKSFEQESIKTKTLKPEELSERIYKGENLPQDKRFLPVKDGGVFKYFRIDLPDWNDKDKSFPIVEVENEIVGLGELEKSPHEEKMLWIKFLSVDPKYQGKGYATKLAEEIFRFAQQEGFSLKGSIYSDEGEQKLKHLFSRFAEQFSVNYIEPAIK